MNCERCGKRLSRKTARQIDGEILCSSCMFAPVDTRRMAETHSGSGPQDRVAR